MSRCASFFWLWVAAACTSTSYREDAPLTGGNLLQQLRYVSQIDLLDGTIADHARCSAAASLNAYLLLGGDFAALARRLKVPTELTFANVHRVQEALYHRANRDGSPGIFGAARPQYDADGNLTGWQRHEGDEFHSVLEDLGLAMDRVYAPTKQAPNDKRAAVQAWLRGDRPVVFIVGVDEDMENERFVPMHERGNHYVAIVRSEGRFHALDSYRAPGNSTLVELTDQQVEDNLFDTPNALFVVYR